ncbi:MAG: hypothetical protein HYZ53_26045 [Planctomycetes bacterium]|nr:hypothetical protein [Planctomycetota bacterium]
MLRLLVLAPAAAGALAFLLRANAHRLALLVAVALLHAGLVLGTWTALPPADLDGHLALDALGQLFLTLLSVLFVPVSAYACAYLSHDTGRPNRTFVGCLLFFLSAMTLVTLSQSLGLLWVAVEATTLASAPLIYHHRSPRALEATWKYLVICSVGIALALLGTFFLAMAASDPRSGATPLLLPELVLLARAHALSIPWLRGGFVLLLIGYGTKMGLAPLHTWLPDAHSEAPSPASALLSGALLNCAFLGILRVLHVCVAADQAAFAQDLLVVLGLGSMGVAAAFILKQPDYKRMLAYSSVEHMGILALGVGLGGAGVFGALFHAVNHSLTKALLFLAAGNLLLAYQSKSVSDVTGALRRLPLTGVLFLAGFFAITGTPPFGMFLSEFTILSVAATHGRYLVATLYVGFLAMVFIGMGNIVLRMVQGDAPAPAASGHGPPSSHAPSPAAASRESWFLTAPPCCLAAAALLLGVWMPPGVHAALDRAVAAVAG